MVLPCILADLKDTEAFAASMQMNSVNLVLGSSTYLFFTSDGGRLAKDIENKSVQFYNCKAGSQ